MVYSIFPRTISSQISRPFIRSFAEIVAVNPPRRQRRLRRRDARLLAGTAPSEAPELAKSKPNQKLIQKIHVREDHGLYAFFRRKPDDTLKGEDRFEVVESPDTFQVLTGMVVSAVKIRLY
jgi:large subunit ribosomal protein L47